MKVKCIQLLNAEGKPVSDTPWVKLGRVYQVLAVEVVANRSLFRMYGEARNSPGLLPQQMFEIVSPIIPAHWIIATTGPGSFDLAPEPWTHKGFWERYFDFDPEAIACFERELAKTLAADP